MTHKRYMHASVADLKAKLGSVLDKVNHGEECIVLRHSKPVAKIVPYKTEVENKTTPGCGTETIKILGDLTKPFLDRQDWDMLK